VRDVAVIGVPHEKYGEVPRAFIVPTCSKLTVDEVKNFVADKVSDYKRLEGGVHFVHSIPTNPSGKILRRKLKEMYCK
jgi:acyl-CoA synthetase (AMP-forming)/AMP-acid ligase II